MCSFKVARYLERHVESMLPTHVLGFKPKFPSLCLCFYLRQSCCQFFSCFYPKGNITSISHWSFQLWCQNFFMMQLYCERMAEPCTTLYLPYCTICIPLLALRKGCWVKQFTTVFKCKDNILRIKCSPLPMRLNRGINIGVVRWIVKYFLFVVLVNNCHGWLS